MHVVCVWKWKGGGAFTRLLQSRDTTERVQKQKEAGNGPGEEIAAVAVQAPGYNRPRRRLLCALRSVLSLVRAACQSQRAARHRPACPSADGCFVVAGLEPRSVRSPPACPCPACLVLSCLLTLYTAVMRFEILFPFVPGVMPRGMSRRRRRDPRPRPTWRGAYFYFDAGEEMQ